MDYENLIVEIKDRIARVTVNRPKVLNALNEKTVREIHAAFSSLRDDAGVGAVSLTVAGAKAFVAAADRMVDAQEALRIGLVNRVLPQADLLPHCEKVAGEILSRGALAVRYAMDAAIRGMETDLTQGLDRESGHFGLLAATADMREG